jgi:hypothetical protein
MHAKIVVPIVVTINKAEGERQARYGIIGDRGEIPGYQCVMIKSCILIFGFSSVSPAMVNVRAWFLSADARWILDLAREPAAEAVVGFQITDLPFVGRGILDGELVPDVPPLRFVPTVPIVPAV